MPSAESNTPKILFQNSTTGKDAGISTQDDSGGASMLLGSNMKWNADGRIAPITAGVSMAGVGVDNQSGVRVVVGAAGAALTSHTFLNTGGLVLNGTTMASTNTLQVNGAFSANAEAYFGGPITAGGNITTAGDIDINPGTGFLRLGGAAVIGKAEAQPVSSVRH